MIDTSCWTKFATTSNADFYEIEPRVLAVVPFDGTTDNATTAAESVAAQLRYLQLVGITPFGRAVASIFIGLNPPRVPTRFFATMEEAFTWVKITARGR